MEMNHEQLEQQRKQLESGAPIPPVNASDIRQMWAAARRIPSRPNVVIGMGAYAACGVEAASDRPEQMLAIWHRQNMLAALVARGVLNDYLHGEEMDEKVFRAAATIPCNQEDWKQAMFPLMLAQLPADHAAKVREEAHAAGIDLDNLPIDRKFLDWLRDNG